MVVVVVVMAVAAVFVLLLVVVVVVVVVVDVVVVDAIASGAEIGNEAAKDVAQSEGGSSKRVREGFGAALVVQPR